MQHTADTLRNVICTHVCHMRVHSKYRVPTAKIIIKGPRATTRHRLADDVSTRRGWRAAAWGRRRRGWAQRWVGRRAQGGELGGWGGGRMASGFCSAPRAQRQGRAIRGREAHRVRMRASRAAKCAEFSGSSNAPIFAAIGTEGRATSVAVRSRCPGCLCQQSCSRRSQRAAVLRRPKGRV